MPNGLFAWLIVPLDLDLAAQRNLKGDKPPLPPQRGSQHQGRVELEAHWLQDVWLGHCSSVAFKSTAVAVSRSSAGAALGTSPAVAGRDNWTAMSGCHAAGWVNPGLCLHLPLV